MAAPRVTNADAKNKELIVLLTNFVFISVIFLLSFDFLFLFWPSLISRYAKFISGRSVR